MIVGRDGDLNAPRAEPSELGPHPREARGVGAGYDRHVEPRAAACPQRVLADRLGGVRGEPADAVELAALALRGHDVRRDAGRRIARLLGLAAQMDEGDRRLHQVAVAPHPVEDTLR